MNRQRNTIIFGFAVLLLLAMADMLCGGVRLSFAETFGPLFGRGGSSSAIVWGVRVPRVLTAIFAGAALGISGALMQAIFRNPLADPHIMGVSGGASLGAALATTVAAGTAALGAATIAASAFIGAVLTTTLIMAVASRLHNATTLLIFGVMLCFIFSAITSLVEYSADDASLKAFYGWSAGHFTGTTGLQTAIMAIGLAICALIAALSSKGLDIVLFGDEYAALSGAKVDRIRFAALSACCIATGAVTAFCGPIGFIGIISPHVARSLCGTSVHRKMLPSAALAGSSLAVIADAVSSLSPNPVPAGSIAAIIGIPAILFILIKKN
jgi:iron complex transport system permease protein